MYGTEDKLKIENIELIKFYTNQVRQQFRYSRSGFRFRNLKREGFDRYESPDDAQFKLIAAYFRSYNFLEGFEKMLSYKTADCCHQAILLGLILKNIPQLNGYHILLTRCNVTKEDGHSFITLRWRNPTSPMRMEETHAAASFYKADVITADSWGNKVISNFPHGGHPMDHYPEVNFWELECKQLNFDFCFIDAAQRFSNFWNETTTESTLKNLKIFCKKLRSEKLVRTGVKTHLEHNPEAKEIEADSKSIAEAVAAASLTHSMPMVKQDPEVSNKPSDHVAASAPTSTPIYGSSPPGIDPSPSYAPAAH